MELHEDSEPVPGETYFTDAASIEPLAHPLRMDAYIEATKHPVSAKELARTLGQPLTRMSYHVRLLAEAGLLRPVRRTPVRGAVETHYRAVATLEVGDEALAASPDMRSTMAGVGVERVVRDLREALADGAAADPSYAFARAHVRVDARGRTELEAALREFYAKLGAIEADAHARLAEAEEQAADPLNVIVGVYPGERSGGRNGGIVDWNGVDQPLIPPMER